VKLSAVSNVRFSDILMSQAGERRNADEGRKSIVVVLGKTLKSTLCCCCCSYSAVVVAEL